MSDVVKLDDCVPKEVERLRKALLCPECLGRGRVAVFGFTGINWLDCSHCEAAQIRREAKNMSDKVQLDGTQSQVGGNPDHVLRINDPYRFQGCPEAKLEIKSTEGQDVEGLQLSVGQTVPGWTFHDSSGAVVCHIDAQGTITGDVKRVLELLQGISDPYAPAWRAIQRLIEERDVYRELLASAVRLLKYECE